MSGWTFILIGVASIAWPIVAFGIWSGWSGDEGDFERWLMSLSLHQMTFFKSLILGGVGLVGIGLSMVALP